MLMIIWQEHLARDYCITLECERSSQLLVVHIHTTKHNTTHINQLTLCNLSLAQTLLGHALLWAGPRDKWSRASEQKRPQKRCSLNQIIIMQLRLHCNCFSNLAMTQPSACIEKFHSNVPLNDDHALKPKVAMCIHTKNNFQCKITRVFRPSYTQIPKSCIGICTNFASSRWQFNLLIYFAYTSTIGHQTNRALQTHTQTALNFIISLYST